MKKNLDKVCTETSIMKALPDYLADSWIFQDATSFQSEMHMILGHPFLH